MSTIKLKKLLKEYSDKNVFKVPVSVSQSDKNHLSYFNVSGNSNDDLKVIIKLLKGRNFKYKGKTSGHYPSEHWYYDGKKYPIGNYRLTGHYELRGNPGDFIEVEEINFN